MSIRIKLGLVLLAAAVLVSGSMDAEDSIQDLSATCSMIESGAWPLEVEPRCGGDQ